MIDHNYFESKLEFAFDKYPPNYEDICKAFDIAGNEGVVFTYGDTLYLPAGKAPDQPLLLHEQTHSMRQLEMGVEKWWAKYLKDAKFRFDQELEAYRNQYLAMDKLTVSHRAAYLDHIATDLSGPIYGNIISKYEAKKQITRGIYIEDRPAGPTSTKSIRKKRKQQRQNRKAARR